MVLTVLHIVLILSLLFCVYQDVKDRTIHLIWFGLILLTTLSINYLKGNNWADPLFAMLFLTINIGVLFLYVSFKNKKRINIFDNHLGLGDILFFVAIMPLFSLRNFVLYFILGMIVSMILHLFFNRFQKHLTIPLAGYLSLFLISIESYSIITSNYSFLKIDII